MLIASVAVYNGAAFTAIDTALRIQAAMLVAGIGTLIQRYPVWRIGSRLPVVMGLSFTFLSAMMTLAAKDYGLMIGAVIVGGCVEGLLGLSAKYWRRFVSPIVSACVVTTIGFSLLSTGISSFASSSVYPTGSWQNLLVAVITLAACLRFQLARQGLLEAAVRSVRSCRGLYRLAVLRHGRFRIHEEHRAGAGHHRPAEAVCVHPEV